MASPRSTIVAVTSDDARHIPVLTRAAAAARERNARVILFDLDADLGPLESPLPTAWSGDGEEQQFGSRLDANDLEAAGQGRLAERVRTLEDAGIEATGWLPPNADADALANYAADQGADLVIVSTDDTDLIDSFTSGRTEVDDEDAEAAPARIHVEAVPPG
jgi:nucleotide-binding universal stress UspA family protein